MSPVSNDPDTMVGTHDVGDLSHEMAHYLTLPRPWNSVPYLREPLVSVINQSNTQFVKQNAQFNMTVESYPTWRTNFMIAVHRKIIPIANKMALLTTTVKQDQPFQLLLNSIQALPSHEIYLALIKHLESNFGAPNRQIKPRQRAIAALGTVTMGDRAALAKFNAAVFHLISTYRDYDQLPGLSEFNDCFDKLDPHMKSEYQRDRPSEDGTGVNLDLRVLHLWTSDLWDHWTKLNMDAKAQTPRQVPKSTHKVITDTYNVFQDDKRRSDEDNDHLTSEEMSYYCSQMEDMTILKTSDGRRVEDPTCCFCPKGKNSHLIVKCEKFLNSPVVRKVDTICKDGRCLKCFRRNHVAKECTSKVKCRKCSEGHNTHLHEYYQDRKKAQQKAYLAGRLEPSSDDEYHDGFTSEQDMLAAERRSEDHANLYRASTPQPIAQATLPMIPVTLRNGKKTMRVNALLDSGATSSLMSQEICDELGLEGPKFKSQVALACDLVAELDKMKVSCNIVIPNHGERILHACAVKNAVGDLESLDWNQIKQSYAHLSSVPFPEHLPGQVQLLLGVNEWDLILPLEMPLHGKEGDPVAYITRLGWTACGVLNADVRREHAIKAVFETYARASLSRISDDELESKQDCINRISSLKELESRLRSGHGLEKDEYRLLYALRKRACPLDEQEQREKRAKVDTHFVSPDVYAALERSIVNPESDFRGDNHTDLVNVKMEESASSDGEISLSRSSQPGPAGGEISLHKPSADTNINFSKAFEDELTKKILSEWEPDVSPSDESPSLSIEQERCWNLMREKRVFKDGHYFMPVLWRAGEPQLEPDYPYALKRLDDLMRNLKRHGLTKEYDDQIREHISAGYLVKVEPHSGRFYLPHFAVIRDDKSTTQLRQVFDGAAARRGGRSLNSAMSPGPKLITDLVQVLMYYRAHRVALAGDIRHMFLQIFMFEEDRLYHHILHRKEEGAPIEELRWTRHPFGSAGSPAVAIGTLKLHAHDHKDEFPLAAEDVLRHSLVDDILSSYPTEAEAIDARRQWSELCEKAGMLVRKFITNSPDVYENIPEELREKRASLDLDVQSLEGEHMLKTLGMRYSAKTDGFSYGIDLSDSPNADGWTKRKILTCYSRFFDPLGLLAPFTIIPRHAFQALWRQEIGWDDPLGPIQEWQDWLESAKRDVVKIKIPRCVTRLLDQGACDVVEQSLHVFADASTYALGVAIYLVTVYTDGLVITNNVRSRAKLAQLKPTTIPRLELAAALLAVETAQNVITTYKLDKITYYTDSMTTLLWLRTKHRQLKQYVANRVMKILGRSGLTDWFYVNTLENPADIPSRGALASEIVDNDLWWHGPAFLRERRLPEQPDLIVKEEQRDEFVKETRDLFEETPTEIACRLSVIPCDAHLQGFELEPLRCEDAKLNYLSEALDFYRDQVIGDDLTRRQEDDQLLRRLIIGAQKHVWPELFDECKPSHPLARVAPRVDHTGLLRITTRISLSKDIDVNPTPILLPNKEVISWLIVKDFHENELKHVGGPAYLLSRIRKDYWIHRGTRLVQRVLRHCLECRFKRAKPTPASEAPLPRFRLPTMEPVRAFTEVGTDCAGPWEVNVGRRTEKRWVVLFVCMITRAIYVEVVDSLSTEKFLTALDMLSARRGMPKKIYSDNGTNFKGASKILNELLENNKSSLDTHAHRIEWIFNTPFSPHQGGLWERSIGTLKSAMQRMLTSEQYLAHKLQAEEFRALVTTAEGYVNNRPLTAVSMEAGDLAPISPADFCLANDAVAFSPTTTTTQGGRRRVAKSTTHQKRWLLLQQYQEMLWRRLRREVVPKYSEYRRSWLRNKANLRKGDVVIVMEPNSKGVHRLGRVLEVFQGADGVARNAKVKVLKTAEELEEEIASKRKKMTAEIQVGHKIYQRSLSSLAVLASIEEIDRVKKADLPPVPEMEDEEDQEDEPEGGDEAEVSVPAAFSCRNFDN